MQTYDNVANRQARKPAFHFITDLFWVNVISISWRVKRVLDSLLTYCWFLFYFYFMDSKESLFKKKTLQVLTT